MTGRRRDRAPEGFVTTREAADMLGVSTSAIRQRIKLGTLPTREGDVTPGLETRHYIPRDVIEQELRERELPANQGHVRESAKEILAHLDTAIEAASNQRDAIEEAIKDQDVHVSGRLDNVLENQEQINRQVSEAVSIMREAARLEKEFQRRMIEMLDREAQRQADREAKGLPERRSLFRRWFGGG